MSKVVKPYHKDETSKKEQVEKMFDNIAPYYDFLNRFLSLGIDQTWRRKAIAMLPLDKADLILDVATGTADLALQTAKSREVEKIIGIDISAEMLEVGREKIKKKNLTSVIELQQADSENIPYPDNTFDAITVAFGVRNFEHLKVGLAEMHRVLKPGGQLVVLEFSKPHIFPFKQLFNAYFKYVLPTIGKLRSKDPRAYRYLYESVQVFPDGKDFVHILEKTGFKSNQWKSLSLGICSIYTGKK